MEQDRKKPRARLNDTQDWISTFDRELIRAAMDHTPCEVEMADTEGLMDAFIIVVDRDFIKLEVVDGKKKWFNRSLISNIYIGTVAQSA